MSHLFNIEKIRKVFDILEKQGRGVNLRYLNWNKDNPNYKYCEKEVFIKRISEKVLPSRYIKIYLIESKTVRYIYISNISYFLGHGEGLQIYYLDYGNVSLGIQSRIMGWNDLIHIEGVFCENGDEHKKVLDMFKLDLPTKTYRFLAYDYDKCPEYNKKGSDPKEKMKTYIDIEAITIEDAFNKRNKKNTGNLMITEKFEVL